MSSPNDPTDPNISRTPEYPPQPEYYAQSPGYPTYAQGTPPAQPAQPYPYPQPAPQPYPPYQPYPGQYAPPPMPPKRSNRTLWIVLGSVGGALLILCVICSILAVNLGGQIGKQLGPAFGAAYTLGTFCAAEQDQDYSTAYAQFSSNLQDQITSEQFASNAATHDTENGKVTNCSTDSSDSSGTSISDNQVTFTLRIQRADGPTSTGSVTLVKENGNFKIDSLDQSLGLT